MGLLKPFDLIHLAWDTGYFGINTAKVVMNEALNHNQFDEMIKELLQFDLVYIVNANANAVNSEHIGTKTNAFLTDIRATFEKNINRPHEVIEALSIKNCYKYDGNLVNIAGDAFGYSRYFNDPYLPKDKSNAIYKQWVINSFGSQEKYFITEQTDGNVISFLISTFSGKECRIELIAVDNKYSGQGHGSNMMNKLEQYCKANNVYKIVVSTQGNNVGAMRFYMKNGFILSECSTIFHWWPRR